MDIFAGILTYYWMRLGGLLLLLLFVASIARRNHRQGSPGSRAKRVLYPSLVATLGLALYLGLLIMLLSPVVAMLFALFLALYASLPILLSVLLVECGGSMLGAERDPFWLGASVVAALALAVIWLAWLLGDGLVIAWLAAGEYLTLALVPVIAAISWWSYLPGTMRDLSKTFD